MEAEIIKRDKEYYECVPWIADSMKSGYVACPAIGHKMSGTLVANSSAIVNRFKDISERSEQLF